MYVCSEPPLSEWKMTTHMACLCSVSYCAVDRLYSVFQIWHQGGCEGFLAENYSHIHFCNFVPDFGLLGAAMLLISFLFIGIDLSRNNFHVYLWECKEVWFCLSIEFHVSFCELRLLWSFVGVTKSKSTVLCTSLVIYVWLGFHLKKKSQFKILRIVYSVFSP